MGELNACEIFISTDLGRSCYKKNQPFFLKKRENVSLQNKSAAQGTFAGYSKELDLDAALGGGKMPRQGEASGQQKSEQHLQHPNCETPSRPSVCSRELNAAVAPKHVSRVSCCSRV